MAAIVPIPPILAFPCQKKACENRNLLSQKNAGNSLLTFSASASILFIQATHPPWWTYCNSRIHALAGHLWLLAVLWIYTSGSLIFTLPRSKIWELLHYPSRLLSQPPWVADQIHLLKVCHQDLTSRPTLSHPNRDDGLWSLASQPLSLSPPDILHIFRTLFQSFFPHWCSFHGSQTEHFRSNHSSPQSLVISGIWLIHSQQS